MRSRVIIGIIAVMLVGTPALFVGWHAFAQNAGQVATPDVVLELGLVYVPGAKEVTTLRCSITNKGTKPLKISDFDLFGNNFVVTFPSGKIEPGGLIVDPTPPPGVLIHPKETRYWEVNIAHYFRFMRDPGKYKIYWDIDRKYKSNEIYFFVPNPDKVGETAKQ